MNTKSFPDMTQADERISFEPTRTAGLARLDQFVRRTGQHYARTRNYDFGPQRRSNVSALSPWLRHRLLSEQEVLQSVLARHTPSGAEKFIQEVFWRSYFKGWLEHRPSVWRAYQRDLVLQFEALDQTPELAASYAAAVTGQTGIEPFDAWVTELIDTGYLHNHTRMWFASIWIFTLKLPWQLGADFFLRHLLDGDPASNTLSWRWVGGLHTKGKTYLARADNIAKYTEGRFHPIGQLAQTAEPLIEKEEHPLVPIRIADLPPTGSYLLLVTEEDAQARTLMPHPPEAIVGLTVTQGRSPKEISSHAKRFATGALVDSVGGGEVLEVNDWGASLVDAAIRAKVTTIATAYAPVGPVTSRLVRAKAQLAHAGIDLIEVRRAFDGVAWPHASKGFFALKKKIPPILKEIGLSG
jgi:hypothetical protein